MIERAVKVPYADHSLPSLTGLRGLAAVWVLLYHAWVYVTPQEILLNCFGATVRIHVFFSLGWAGVHVLFVLSGFLLTLPYARANAGLSPRPQVARYLLRRIARVFPAYYLQLVLLLGITLATSGVLLIDWSNAVQYLLMLFVPPPVGIGGPASVNGVWWTLPIELSFYFVLPLLAWLADRRRKLLLVAVSLLSMVIWRYFALVVINPSSEPSVWAYQLPGSMDTFGLGMLGAVLHVQYSQTPERAAIYRKFLAILLMLSVPVFVLLGMWMAEQYASYWSVTWITFLWTPIFGGAVLVVILNCGQNHALLNRLLGNRQVFYMGTVSYGLYLWHYPIGNWLLGSRFIADMTTYQFPRLALLMFLCSLAVASISWYLVEAKAIARARRR